MLRGDETLRYVLIEEVPASFDSFWSFFDQVVYKGVFSNGFLALNKMEASLRNDTNQIDTFTHILTCKDPAMAYSKILKAFNHILHILFSI